MTRSRILQLLTALAVAVPGGVLAQAIDPVADQVLRQMSAYLASADRFTVQVESSDDYALGAGQVYELRTSVEVALRRPDKLRVDERGDHRRVTLFLKSGEVALVDDYAATFAKASVSSQLDRALDELFDRFGVLVPIADMLYSDTYAAVMDGVLTGVYLGQHVLDGELMHHLAFTQETIDWQVWIQTGARPVPRRLVIIYKSEMGMPRLAYDLSEWDMASALPDHVFDFVPLPDAVEIELATPDSEGS